MLLACLPPTRLALSPTLETLSRSTLASFSLTKFPFWGIILSLGVAANRRVWAGFISASRIEGVGVPSNAFSLFLCSLAISLFLVLFTCTILPSSFLITIFPAFPSLSSFAIKAASSLLFLKKCVGLSFISLITRKTSASLLNISGCFRAKLFRFAAHSSLNTPLKSFIHFSGSNLCSAYCFASLPSLIVQPSPFTTSCFASACSSLLPCSAVSLTRSANALACSLLAPFFSIVFA